jgi:hypothetical protein
VTVHLFRAGSVVFPPAYPMQDRFSKQPRLEPCRCNWVASLPTQDSKRLFTLVRRVALKSLISVSIFPCWFGLGIA